MRKKLLLFLVTFVALLGTVSAAAPTITGTSLTPQYPADGESVTLDIAAEDDTGITEIGVDVYDPSGNLDNSDSGSFSSPYPTSYDTSTDGGSFGYTPDETGTWEIVFYVEDDEGNRVEVTRTQDVTSSGGEPAPTFSPSAPLEGDSLSYQAGNGGANVPFTGDLLDAPSSGTLVADVQGPSGTFTVNLGDPSSSGDYSYFDSETLTEGTYDYQLIYTSDDTGNEYTSNVITFSVNEEDNPPTVDDISTDPSSPNEGQATDITITGSDDVGITEVSYTVYDGTGQEVTSGSGTYSTAQTSIDETFSDAFTPQFSETYEVQATLTDTEGQSSSDSIDVTVGSEPEPTFNLNNPVDGETFTYGPGESGSSVTYDGSVDADFSGTLEIYRGNTQIYQESVSSGSNSYSFTETITQGNYSYYIEYTSDSTSNIYTSNTRDFTVSQSSETPPAISTSYPGDGDTIYFSEGEASTNVTFEGSVSAPYDATAYVQLNDNTQCTFQHTPDSTSIPSDCTESLVEGLYEWNMIVESSQTATNYSGNTRSFSINVSNETPVNQEIVLPDGGYSAEKLVNPIDYSAWLDADYSGSTSFEVVYPDESSPVQIVSQPDFSIGNNTFNGSFTLDPDENQPGTYTFRMRSTSDVSGNTYRTSQDFTVFPEPSFDYVRPNNTSVVMDESGESFHNTLFQARLEYVNPGFVEYQIRTEGNDWETIQRTEIINYRDEVTLDFSHVVQDISFVDTRDGRRVSENYTARVTYSPSSSTSIYSSDFVEFNFIEPQASGIQRIGQLITAWFGQQALMLVTLLFVALIGAYTRVATGSDLIGIVGSVAATVGFVSVGFISGWIGFILTLGIILAFAYGVSGNG